MPNCVILKSYNKFNILLHRLIFSLEQEVIVKKHWFFDWWNKKMDQGAYGSEGSRQ